MLQNNYDLLLNILLPMYSGFDLLHTYESLFLLVCVFCDTNVLAYEPTVQSYTHTFSRTGIWGILAFIEFYF